MLSILDITAARLRFRVSANVIGRPLGCLASFNNFVGAGEQRRRHVDAERLCRLDHSSRRLRPIVIAADATLVKPALVRYLDRTKSRPFRPNCSQCFSDSIPDDIAFVGGRMIDTDFDSNLLSSLLAAHCPIPDVGNWIGGGCSRVNISVVIPLRQEKADRSVINRMLLKAGWCARVEG